MITVIGATEVMVDIRMGAPQNPEEQNMQTNADMGAFPDREAQAEEIFKEGRDRMTFRSCGCGFNIAGYLADEGYDVSFISAVGDDIAGIGAVQQLKAKGVNTDGVGNFKGTTPVRVTFFNILGDTEMEKKNDILMEKLTPEYLEKCGIPDGTQAIVMDGTLPEETIEYICEKYSADPDVKLFFDPAGKPGSLRVAEHISGFDALMPGRQEAETITGKTILSEDQLMAAGRFFDENGVDTTVITMKGGGLYYKAGMNEGILRPERIISFASTSGAGDVTSAALIAGIMRGESIDTAAGYAMSKAAEFLADVDDRNIL